MQAMGKGDVIGGLFGAPFELVDGALQTATAPLTGTKPGWIKDAEIASMKVTRPKINDPNWCQKFDKELKDGTVLMPSFEENLEAYKLTSNEKYLSHAEQLATTPAQRSALETQVLRSLGSKAFDMSIHIDGQSASPKYREGGGSVLFISGKVYGAQVHPKGSATVRLRGDLPFTVKDHYRVTIRFRFTIPRESTMYFMGLQNVTKRDSVGTVTRTFVFGPGVSSATASLDFGRLNGAGAVAVLGSQSKIEVTGSPYTSFEIIDVVKQ